jgi:hypothetical protein
MKMSLALLLSSVVLPLVNGVTYANCFIKRINDIIEVNHIIVEQR